MDKYTKIVVRHKVGKALYANAYIIPDHYNHSLTAFLRLWAEVQRSFPCVGLDDVECMTVLDSGRFKGQPIIRFPFYPGIATPDGWTEAESLKAFDIII